MINANEFSERFRRCASLAAEQRYGEALAVGRELLGYEGQAEHPDLQRMLALLYGLNDQHMEAATHYLYLCQFDEGYELHHCLQVARGYREKGMTQMAAILAHAGAVKLQAAELYALAADYYEQAGDAQQAAEIRNTPPPLAGE